PVLTHFSNECFKLINQNTSSILWPEINEKLIEEQVLNYVIQIGGKKRGLIQAEKNISEKDLMNLVQNNNELKKYFVNKSIKKKIFIPNRLLNIIV
ncbi:MAG: leucine--tRNA ligase, partial [Gammaproteobacteria bacterium]